MSAPSKPVLTDVIPPKSWLPCTPLPSGLVAGKFLAFKTPVARKFRGKLADREFQVSHVFDYLHLRKLDMGLWIDLSIPVRYDPEEVESRGCRYLKVKCGMDRRPPTVGQTSAIISTIKEFIKSSPRQIIGVHCTHGHNRTGFIIISSLIEIYGWTLQDGLMEFSRVRPPGIYRDFLLAGLQKRYAYHNIHPELNFPYLLNGTGEGTSKNVTQDKKSDSTNKGKKTQATNNGPRPGTSNNGPRPGTSNNGPRPGTSNNGPKTGTSNKGPKPGTSNNGPKPGTSNKGPKPGTSNNGPKPGTSNKGPKPGTSNNGPKPGTSNNGPKPGTSNNGPKPGTSNNEPKPGTSNNEPKPGTSNNGPTNKGQKGKKMNKSGKGKKVMKTGNNGQETKSKEEEEKK